MKSLLVCALFFSSLAMGSAPIDFETSCRMKAKEVASETYRGCITENKTARIEKIRDEYQEEVRALKEKFEGKIGKLSGKSTATKKSRRQSRPVQKVIENPIQYESPATGPDESTMDIPEPIPMDTSNL